jgi:hypothetical protein
MEEMKAGLDCHEESKSNTYTLQNVSLKRKEKKLHCSLETLFMAS